MASDSISREHILDQMAEGVPTSVTGKANVAQDSDGLVRSVQVRTANSYLDRPVSKLCFLEETVDGCPVAESTEELDRGSSVGGAVDTPRDVGGKDEDLGQMNAAGKRPVRSRRAPKGHEDFVRYWSGICLLIANGLGPCWLISLAVGRGNL